MQYHFMTHEGFWAECLELEGCFTQDGTLEILKKNAAHALNLYLDEPDIIFPRPDDSLAKRKGVFSVDVDPRIEKNLIICLCRRC